MKKASDLNARMVAVKNIDEPAGVIRLEIDALEIRDLGRNIEEVGLVQPIIVRPVGKRFEIVAGHRRFLAVKGLGWQEIACIIRRIDDLQCALARASENLGRVDLSPIEEAAVYSELHKQHKLSYEQIGSRMGRTAGVVKRRLDLLRMPPQLQQAIHKKEINYSVGEVLWSLGDIEAIDYYLMFAIENGATRNVVAEWVKDWKDRKRREGSDVGGGGGLQSPMESRPYYTACDLCNGPMEIGTETTIRTCPGCTKVITDAVKAEES